ncbi:MAG TPA: right-handed parallel beta-helix repeat-containing protein [Candidatus Sulfotelmatobacter sp.]|nr:right-handed parallel beta-helix repeat-containing protein [Candidatus Sulfotelmatobacter sp.]
MHSLITKLYLKSALCAFVVLPALAHAGTLYVNCGGHRGLTQIQKAINLLLQEETSGSNTILVSGSCKENITIQSMDNLTLTAQDGASISDNSGGTLDVVDIFDSRRVSLNGFTINGGANGVVCADASLCRFAGNTVQGSSGYGVIVASAQATLKGDRMQNNAGRGLSIINGGEVDATGVTVQGSLDGIALNTRGTLTLSNSTVNGNQNHGIVAVTSSTVRLFGATVTENAGDGVALQQSSQAKFDSLFAVNMVTNNGGAGVSVSDLSFAFFAPTSVVTGNGGGTDVVCAPQFSVTRGALTNIAGGSTNCVEP